MQHGHWLTRLIRNGVDFFVIRKGYLSVLKLRSRTKKKKKKKPCLPQKERRTSLNWSSITTLILDDLFSHKDPTSNPPFTEIKSES